MKSMARNSYEGVRHNKEKGKTWCVGLDDEKRTNGYREPDPDDNGVVEEKRDKTRIQHPPALSFLGEKGQIANGEEGNPISICGGDYREGGAITTKEETLCLRPGGKKKSLRHTLLDLVTGYQRGHGTMMGTRKKK